MTIPIAVPAMTNALAVVMDDLLQVTESAVGYRASLEAAGFSPKVAEWLAGNYIMLTQQLILKGKP